MEKCNYCGCDAGYVVEYWGLNQFGENPVVMEEIPVCSDPSHISFGIDEYSHEFGDADNIMEISTHENFGLNITNLFRIIQNRTQLEFCFYYKVILNI